MFSDNAVNESKAHVYGEDGYNTSDGLTTTVGAKENDDGGFNMPSDVQGFLICGGLALIVAIVLFIFVVKTSHVFKNKFMAWFKEFLNFRSILIESILKFLYVFLALFTTFSSFLFLKESILEFLAILIVGNLLLRVVFEFSLMAIIIWKNTSDIAKFSERISDKVVDSGEVKETKETPEIKPEVVEKVEKTETLD